MVCGPSRGGDGFLQLNDPDSQKAGRVMQAKLKMKKIDVERLQQAYENR